MKVLSWMHNKLTGRHEIKKDISVAALTVEGKLGYKTDNTRRDSRGEEFDDWPHGLLTIGTFGNHNSLKQELNKSDDILQDFTREELNKLQKEIAQILNRQEVDGLLDTQNPQSGNILEDDDDSDNNKDNRFSRLERSMSIVLNREKDIRGEQTKGSIRKKSLSFILKKMLVCRSGFAPTKSLRDHVLDKSRLEKILRAILHKKIYPQNSNPKPTAKKYLQTNRLHNYDSDDELFEVENDGSKWVKTDSDYIVLEI